MQAVLHLMSQGKLPVERLTSHRFPVDRAAEAYDLITTRREPFLGVILEYGDPAPLRHTHRLASRSRASKPDNNGQLGVSLIGAGNFARLVMLPALSEIGGVTWRGVCTAKGVTAGKHRSPCRVRVRHHRHN